MGINSLSKTTQVGPRHHRLTYNLAQLLKKKVEQVSSKLFEKIKVVEKVISRNKKTLDNYKLTEQKELEKLDNEFTEIFSTLEKRKEMLKSEFMAHITNEAKQLKKTIKKQDEIINNLGKNLKSLGKLSKELCTEPSRKCFLSYFKRRPRS